MSASDDVPESPQTAPHASPPPPPAYPPAAPPGYPSASPPPHKRPGVTGYVIGSVLAIVGVLGGIALFAIGLTHALRGPEANTQFENNGSTTVQIEAGSDKTLYTDDSAPNPREYRCTAHNTGNGPDAHVQLPTGSATMNNWHSLFTVSAEQSGSYRITCSGPSGANYSVGPALSGVALGAAIIGPFLGFGLVVIAIVVVIVTALRRRPPRPPLPPYPPYPYWGPPPPANG